MSPHGSMVCSALRAKAGGSISFLKRGGAVRRVADRGTEPRFSPDGKLISYSARMGDGRTAGLIVPTAGRPCCRVKPDSPHSLTPIWSPDGGHVAFLSATDAQETAYDWWVAPVEHEAASGRRPMRTFASDLLASERIGYLFQRVEIRWIGTAIRCVPAARGGRHAVWREGTGLEAAGPCRQCWRVPLAQAFESETEKHTRPVLQPRVAREQHLVSGERGGRCRA